MKGPDNFSTIARSRAGIMKSETIKTDSSGLRLSAEEKREFREAAKIAAIPLSGCVRQRLRRIAVRELQDRGRFIPFLTI